MKSPGNSPVVLIRMRSAGAVWIQTSKFLSIHLCSSCDQQSTCLFYCCVSAQEIRKPIYSHQIVNIPPEFSSDVETEDFPCTQQGCAKAHCSHVRSPCREQLASPAALKRPETARKASLGCDCWLGMGPKWEFPACEGRRLPALDRLLVPQQRVLWLS